MARKKTTVVKDENPAIVATNFEEEKKTIEESSETVTIACHLAHGIRFTDIPNGQGGTKVITLPGINDRLRGQPSGILLGKGKAVAVTLKKSDWEAIKALHGKEAAFVGVNGNLPCIIEMKSTQEFKARKDEVAEMVHGLEPLEPKKEGVQEVKKDE